MDESTTTIADHARNNFRVTDGSYSVETEALSADDAIDATADQFRCDAVHLTADTVEDN